jgi:hypothetical protein
MQYLSDMLTFSGDKALIRHNKLSILAFCYLYQVSQVPNRKNPDQGKIIPFLIRAFWCRKLFIRRSAKDPDNYYLLNYLLKFFRIHNTASCENNLDVAIEFIVHLLESYL